MIHVVIPAFNEEVALPRIVTKIDRVMLEWDWEYQVIVCDDGSRDGTAEVLDHLRVHYPLTVICHTINRGLGESMRDLLESAAAISRDGDVIVRMDGDDTHEPTFIPRLVSRIEEGYDVVTASRFQRDGGQLGVGAYRAFVSRCANLFMKILFPIRGVMEYSCGYRAYRASLIKRADRGLWKQLCPAEGLGIHGNSGEICKIENAGGTFFGSGIRLALRPETESEQNGNQSYDIGLFCPGDSLLLALGWLAYDASISEIRIDFPNNRSDAFRSGATS